MNLKPWIQVRKTRVNVDTTLWGTKPKINKGMDREPSMYIETRKKCFICEFFLFYIE